MNKVQYIVDSKGNKTAAVIDLKTIPHAAKYIESVIEDLSDIEIIEKRRREKDVPLGDLRIKLQKNGIL